MTGLDPGKLRQAICNFAKAYGAGVEKVASIIMIGKSKAEAD